MTVDCIKCTTEIYYTIILQMSICFCKIKNFLYIDIRQVSAGENYDSRSI